MRKMEIISPKSSWDWEMCPYCGESLSKIDRPKRKGIKIEVLNCLGCKRNIRPYDRRRFNKKVKGSIQEVCKPTN